jgi:hypothetical protein
MGDWGREGLKLIANGVLTDKNSSDYGTGEKEKVLQLQNMEAVQQAMVHIYDDVQTLTRRL